MKLIEVGKIGGIKCDCCGYRDDTVKYKDYRSWINRPCPRCGANLLTKADYKAARRLMRAVKIINLIPFRSSESQEYTKIRAVFKGGGSISLEDLDAAQEMKTDEKEQAHGSRG